MFRSPSPPQLVLETAVRIKRNHVGERNLSNMWGCLEIASESLEELSRATSMFASSTHSTKSSNKQTFCKRHHMSIRFFLIANFYLLSILKERSQRFHKGTYFYEWLSILGLRRKLPCNNAWNVEKLKGRKLALVNSTVKKYTSWWNWGKIEGNRDYILVFVFGGEALRLQSEGKRMESGLPHLNLAIHFSSEPF